MERLRNLLYAPGYYTGYAAKTLAGVREAMEAGEWELARQQAGRLREALRRAEQTLGYVLINGKLMVDDGERTGALPG